MSGSVLQISWRCGWLGKDTPTISVISGLHAPAAQITFGVRITPRSVTTPVIRLPSVSRSTTRVWVCRSTPRR